MNDKFDLIIVGSSFSATFFLYSYLRKAKKSSRVLVIESGKQDIHSWQLKNKRSSSRDNSDIIINNNSKKNGHSRLGLVVVLIVGGREPLGCCLVTLNYDPDMARVKIGQLITMNLNRTTQKPKS